MRIVLPEILPCLLATNILGFVLFFRTSGMIFSSADLLMIIAMIFEPETIVRI